MTIMLGHPAMASLLWWKMAGLFQQHPITGLQKHGIETGGL